MGLGNAALRKHSGSPAAPHVPNNCFYMSAGGKKINIPQSSNHDGI